MRAGETTHGFDGTYWEDHWARSAAGEHGFMPVNPYVPAETAQLPPGSALDAGCGTGSEAIWLAEQGWQVTGADISSTALATAAERASAAGVDGRTEWVQTDLARWNPRRTWDLVVTSYAHADIDQLALYRRLASWVAPAGTLLIVGHLHGGRNDRRDHQHPEAATTSLGGIADLLAASGWRIDAGYENARTLEFAGHLLRLRDVIVRATRTA